MNIPEALQSLCPKAEWVVRDDEIEWLDSKQTQPSEIEIQTEITRLQAEHDAQEYARNRRIEYPSIEECVHAILDDELEALQIKRQIVKDKYPKE